MRDACSRQSVLTNPDLDPADPALTGLLADRIGVTPVFSWSDWPAAAGRVLRGAEPRPLVRTAV
jgi:hypothetical protein